MSSSSFNFHKIIDGLYLSDYSGAFNISHLVKYKITHIVVCARELECRFPEDFEYLHLELDDLPKSSIVPYLNLVTDFIHSALQSDNTVLVHCAMGISRSPSIVIAYLMRYHCLSYSDALTLVTKCHASTRPMPNFQKQLQHYEKVLKKDNAQTCLCFIF